MKGLRKRAEHMPKNGEIPLKEVEKYTFQLHIKRVRECQAMLNAYGTQVMKDYGLTPQTCVVDMQRGVLVLREAKNDNGAKGDQGPGARTPGSPDKE